MEVSVPIINGYLPDQYGKHAGGADIHQGYPVTSFPIEVKKVPANAESIALWFFDYDAVPVTGFVWIHWLAANIPANVTKIPVNASRTNSIPMIQGNNSFAGSLFNIPDKAINQAYVGPQPPDKDHHYTLRVYALDSMLHLEPGFWLNDMKLAMSGHIVDQTEITIPNRV